MLAEGYRMGQLALQMSHRLNPSILDGRVVAWTYSTTIPWQWTPLAECIPPLLQGHASAMKQGDPCTAFLLINIYFSVSYFSSKYLPLLKVPPSAFAGCGEVLESNVGIRPEDNFSPNPTHMAMHAEFIWFERRPLRHGFRQSYGKTEVGGKRK